VRFFYFAAIFVRRSTVAPRTGRISRALEVENGLRKQIDERRGITDRLPSEIEIANKWGVSRVTVREALSSLERKGIILRRQGLGTFVNRLAHGIQLRLDESVEFGELIRLAGHKSGLSLAECQRTSATPTIAARLCIAPDSETLTLRKVFTADRIPAIHCVNVISVVLATQDGPAPRLDQIDPTISVYDLLFRWFNQSVAYQIGEISPFTADAEIAPLLNCEPGAPLLFVEEVGYNRDQLPLFYAAEYYVPDIIQFRIVRKPL
jgi:DNA-binding GntR family transcriptional regulator